MRVRLHRNPHLDPITIDDLINVASDTGVNAAIYFPEFLRWAGPLHWFTAMHEAKETGKWGITPQMAEMWLSRRAIAQTHTDVYAAPWRRLWEAMLHSSFKLQMVDTTCAECLRWYKGEVTRMKANPEFHTADSAGKPNSRVKDRTYFVSASALR